MNNFKEELISMTFKKEDDFNFKGKVEFCNEEYYIIDAFIHNDIRYLYIIKNKYNEIEAAGGLEKYIGDIEVEYIFKKENEIYSNVTDEELIHTLNKIIEKRFLDGKI